jgi:hypothetical protein
MRQREQPPEVKPCGSHGSCEPSSEACIFGYMRSEAGVANHKRGSRVERQGRSLARQALKGETPGASLVERHQGGRRRSKASRHMVSAKAQHDPDQASPGVVAFVGWVTLKGQKTSGERSRPYLNGSGVIVGQTLKRSESLRKAKRPGQPGRRWQPADHEVGSAKPIGRQGSQVNFERLADRKRG